MILNFLNKVFHDNKIQDHCNRCYHNFGYKLCIFLYQDKIMKKRRQFTIQNGCQPGNKQNKDYLIHDVQQVFRP